MPIALQSPELDAWANGFPVMLAHAGVALLILIVASALFAFLSPNREIALIRDGNPAAAVSFGGVMVSLAMPLAFSLGASNAWVEIGLWGAATAIVQLFLFWLVDLIFFGLPQRIREGDVSAAVMMTGARLAVAGILAAAVSL